MSKSEDYCFVIMPFSKDIASVYFDAIKPTVEALGLKCIRADEMEGPGNIIKQIVEHIVGAKLIIADLTHRNPNVFYELGIAHANGNNTIVIAQDINEVPFDVKAYQVILYSDSIAGGRILCHKITEAIHSIDKWGARSNNPIQDFLPVKNVSEVLYKAALKELEEIKSKLSQTQPILDECENLRTELAKMQETYNTLLKQNNMLQKVQKVISTLLQGENETNTPLPTKHIEHHLLKKDKITTLAAYRPYYDAKMSIVHKNKTTKRITIQDTAGHQYQCDLTPDTTFGEIALDFFQAMGWPEKNTHGSGQRAVVEHFDAVKREYVRLLPDQSLKDANLPDGTILRIYPESIAGGGDNRKIS